MSKDADANHLAADAETAREQLPKIGRPATSALAEVGVTQMDQLAAFSERELLALHGVGAKAIRILREAGARFRAE